MSTITICGHTYQIIERELEGLGESDHIKMTISLDEGMNDDMVKETLWHEILHCILFHTNERGEHSEGTISALSNYLWREGLRPPVQ